MIKKAMYYLAVINDPLFQITEDGEIFRQTDKGGHLSFGWREQPTYTKENRRYFKYQQIELAVHIVVLAKYKRLPELNEWVRFLDGDSNNSAAHNLEIIKKGQKTCILPNLEHFASDEANALASESL